MQTLRREIAPASRPKNRRPGREFSFGSSATGRWQSSRIRDPQGLPHADNLPSDERTFFSRADVRLPTITPSPTLSCHRRGPQRRRRGVRDLGVELLAQAGNAYCTHDCAVYTYRHAAAQYRDAGSDEGRSALIYVILDLRRGTLYPRRRSCLLDG